jgi:peptide chain release factor 2
LISNRLKNSENALITFGGIFDVDGKTATVARLENQSTEPEFWNDNVTAQKVLKEIKELKRTIDSWTKAHKDFTDTRDLYELGIAESDQPTIDETIKGFAAITADANRLEFLLKLSGEDDPLSCHWADMLFRLYQRYLERKGYPFSVLDEQPGDGAGIKSATIEIDAEYAYGYLKAEAGVHRLVRISPYDANARRHTSFASVSAEPIYEDSADIEVNEEDLRIDTFRASGAGGQHINKTDSAVRITHFPSGIVVSCQNERSQIKNRSTAMKVLRSRLKVYYREIEEAARLQKAPEKKKIEWGSQIRSYVLHPYNLVKDHRTDVETSNTQAVLNGEIDLFIEAWLLSTAGTKG